MGIYFPHIVLSNHPKTFVDKRLSPESVYWLCDSFIQTRPRSRHILLAKASHKGQTRFRLGKETPSLHGKSYKKVWITGRNDLWPFCFLPCYLTLINVIIHGESPYYVSSAFRKDLLVPTVCTEQQLKLCVMQT